MYYNYIIIIDFHWLIIIKYINKFFYTKLIIYLKNRYKRIIILYYESIIFFLNLLNDVNFITFLLISLLSIISNRLKKIIYFNYYKENFQKFKNLLF